MDICCIFWLMSVISMAFNKAQILTNPTAHVAASSPKQLTVIMIILTHIFSIQSFGLMLKPNQNQQMKSLCFFLCAVWLCRWLLFFLAEMCERHVVTHCHQIKLYPRWQWERKCRPECGQQKAGCRWGTCSRGLQAVTWICILTEFSFDMCPVSKLFALR